MGEDLYASEYFGPSLRCVRGLGAVSPRRNVACRQDIEAVLSRPPHATYESPLRDRFAVIAWYLLGVDVTPHRLQVPVDNRSRRLSLK